MAAESNKWFSGRKTFCLITGASRGLGKVMATKIAANLGQDSLLLLMAKDLEGLKATKDAVVSKSPGIRASISSCDLAYPDFARFVSIISESLAENNIGSRDFDEVAIIHNAGTIGGPKKALEWGENETEYKKYLAVNVISAACITSAFFKVFTDAHLHKLVVNITSLAAIQPFPSLSMYCAGKAARDAYFASLAAEEPTITVLNYAPGPLDTDMYHGFIADAKTVYPMMAACFQKTIDDGRLITCELTTDKLLSILQGEKNFASGSHIDYTDQ